MEDAARRVDTPSVSEMRAEFDPLKQPVAESSPRKQMLKRSLPGKELGWLHGQRTAPPHGVTE